MSFIVLGLIAQHCEPVKHVRVTCRPFISIILTTFVQLYFVLPYPTCHCTLLCNFRFYNMYIKPIKSCFSYPILMECPVSASFHSIFIRNMLATVRVCLVIINNANFNQKQKRRLLNRTRVTDSLICKI